MSLSELILSLLPILITLVLTVIVIRKTGLFEQRKHREKVEALLERIALALENKN